MRRVLLSLAALSLGFAQTEQRPADVIDFLRSTAFSLSEAHGDGDAHQFLDHFDRSMPNFAQLRDTVEGLVAHGDVGSAIEIVNEEGDDNKRTMDLDWVLEIEDQRPRRAVLKCTIERQKSGWKFTRLEPVEFFKY